MKLKATEIEIWTGGPLLVLVNDVDAQRFDIHSQDRVNIDYGKKTETAVVRITKNSKLLKPGYIGLYAELIGSLGIKKNTPVKLRLARKPHSLAYIKKKMDGGTLNKKEIDQIVWDITHNKLSDIETTYFVSACYANMLNLKETIMLTKSIAEHGSILTFNKKIIIDKHCIGGIPGNRTTMALVPILAALGLTVPKTSSRSITSPAGTADTMEVLASVSLPLNRMKKVVQKLNACIMWGGSINLAPADDKIIKVEKVLDIDAESQLLASIMAKKYSVSSTHIIIDIPISPGGKIQNQKQANHLKRKFELIARALKKNIKVITTDGRQPIGRGIGPALEARDVLWLLERDDRRPLDLEKKVIMMATDVLKMVGIKQPKQKVLSALDSGAALHKMYEIIRAQDGVPQKGSKIKPGAFKHDVRAKKSGKVTAVDNVSVSRIARVAGSPKSKKAGMYLNNHIGDKVKKGDVLYTIYSESKEKLQYAIDSIALHPPYTLR